LGEEAEVYELGQETPFERFFGNISSLMGKNPINQYSLSPDEIQLFVELLRAHPGLQSY